MFRIRVILGFVFAGCVACGGGSGAKSAMPAGSCPATSPEMPAGQLIATSRKVADRDEYDCVSTNVKFQSVAGSASTLGLGLDDYMLVGMQDANTNDIISVLVPESDVQKLYSMKQGTALKVHGALKKVHDGSFPMFFVNGYEVASAQ